MLLPQENSEENEKLKLEHLLKEIEYFFDNDSENHDKVRGTISEAFSLAEEMHKGQTRKSGEEYIQHPLRVTIKLIENLGHNISKETLCKLIITSILHDTLEDTPIKEEKIKNRFGTIVSASVKLLSKQLWSDFIDSEEEKQKVQYLKDVGLINNKLKLNPRAKSLKKYGSKEDKKLISNFEKIQGKYIEIRNRDYFNKLKLLKERKFDELDIMQGLSEEQREEIRSIVLPIKGIDRSDNLETMEKIKIKKLICKIRETTEEIIPVLEDRPEIIKILRKDINELIITRLIYITKPGN